MILCVEVCMGLAVFNINMIIGPYLFMLDVLNPSVTKGRFEQPAITILIMVCHIRGTVRCIYLYVMEFHTTVPE